MSKQKTFIRASYWVAAIADFIVAVQVLSPERMGVGDYVYPMGLMSAVAFSWGVLLLVADRDPIPRRWILRPTALVVALLGVAVLHAGVTGLLPSSRIIGSAAAVIGVLALLVYTSLITRDMEEPAPF